MLDALRGYDLATLNDSSTPRLLAIERWHRIHIDYYSNNDCRSFNKYCLKFVLAEEIHIVFNQVPEKRRQEIALHCARESATELGLDEAFPSRAFVRVGHSLRLHYSFRLPRNTHASWPLAR